MGSFASELGVQFDACMEAAHVIDADSQVCLLQIGRATNTSTAKWQCMFTNYW
jgi:Fanconi anemia group J protein